ncbi:MAG: hypothetical protein H6671_06380 [Anaerolineaceae bacterium]|nr:hypothetical protein [Anaerolineaceae bacterium]
MAGIYNGWYAVNLRWRTGWVRSDVVIASGPCDNLPVVQPPQDNQGQALQRLIRRQPRPDK